MIQRWLLPSRDSQWCKNPEVISLTWAVLMRTLLKNYIQFWSPAYFVLFGGETRESSKEILSGTQNGSVRKKLRKPSYYFQVYERFFEKGPERKKTSLNDSRWDFSQGQECLTHQVNRTLELVTEGLLMPFSRGKNKIHEQTDNFKFSSARHSPSWGQEVNHISPEASCFVISTSPRAEPTFSSPTTPRVSHSG